MEKMVNKYEGGEVAKVEWMDNLAFKAIQKYTEEENKRRGRKHVNLFVEMPTFEHPITFQVGGKGGGGGTRDLYLLSTYCGRGACWFLFGVFLVSISFLDFWR